METSNRMALEVPIMPTRYVRRFIEFMEKRGVKQHALLKGMDVSVEMLDNPDAAISFKQLSQLLSNAEWLMTDERAPFQFGQQLDLPSHGLLGFAVLGKENPRRLISMIVQYMRIGLPLMDMELSSTGATFQIRLIDSWDLGQLRPCVAKMYLGSIYRLASQVCDNFKIQFDFPTAMTEENWQSLASNCEFSFNSSVNQIILPLSGRPIPSAEADLEFMLARNRNRTRETISQADETVAQVREMMVSQPGRFCTTENIARQLDISTRTLRMHLAKANTSFRELRNEIRESFATLYLKDTSVPLETIAEKLGFSDQAGFTKAYRSWTGTTPGDIRRQSKSKPDN